MKLGKKSVRGAVAATAVAIGATALAATPAFAWGTSGWLSANAIVTVDGCGVYSTLKNNQWSSDKSEASETYACVGKVESDLLYTDFGGTYFQVWGNYGDTYSSASSGAGLMTGHNHRALHNH